MKMDTNSKGYGTALKATLVFGGVEMLTILISIARNKLSAIWIGAEGLGILSLYSSLIYLVYTIANLGLQNSAVKEIAFDMGMGDNQRTSKKILALKRWGWATGLAGMLLMIVFSPLLSNWMFHSTDYVLPIIIVSIVILLQSLYRMNHAFLQGVRQIKSMAFASALGALISFVLVVPIFYFFRKEGIIWSLIVTAMVTMVISYYYTSKIKTEPVSLSMKEVWSLGIPAVKLGILMAISSATAYLVQFVLRLFISREGSLADVGLFQAGWTLNGHYLGLVFTAMSKDYFPRISQISADNRMMMKSVNEQAEIAILILAPLIAFMIIFMPICLRFLYSSEFLVIVQMTCLLMIGAMIKAGSWAISYVFPAKGDGKTFMFNEVLTVLLSLPIYLFGYWKFGLLGIGYAFIINYIIYFIWVLAVCKRKYDINYSPKFWYLFGGLTGGLLLLYISTIIRVPNYLVTLPIGLIICAASIIELDKRTNLRSSFLSILKRRKK